MDSVVNKIIPATCKNVSEGNYVLHTEGGVYLVPVGLHEMEEGAIIPLDSNTSLQLHLPFDEDEEETREDVPAEVDRVRRESGYFDNDDDDDDDNDKEGGFAVWTDGATKLLINMYQKYKPLVETRKLKTMKKMWERICGEMISQHKLHFTSQQIESKWKSLERSFKAKIENSKKTGRGRRTCPYEKELGEILLKKRTVVPPCVMDGEKKISSETVLSQLGDDRDERREVQNAANGSQDQLENEEAPAERPSPNETQKTYGKAKKKEIQLLADAIENRTKQKQQDAERKYEQRERFLQEMQRRNDLLEKYLQGRGK